MTLATPLAPVRAPEFPPGFAWHNAAAPLSIRALRGKIVLLDFWTYGCINCQRVLPDLRRLEHKYLRQLVVIGVHTAKFDNESDAASVRDALLRFDITHPVIVDEKRRLWSEYAVRAWPTFVLIDPSGRVVEQAMGEGNHDFLDRAIARLAEDFRERGSLDEEPISLQEAAQVLASPLSYPGKVLVCGGQIFIADSAHNRIVMARADGQEHGQVLAVAGSGARGNRDGDFASATFDSPLGMALRQVKNGACTLFVADSGNDSIRALDLDRGTVSTLRAGLPSPWDVAIHNETLFVAMAGTHQIWAVDLDGRGGIWAGIGREARVDGPRLEAALAQPSGLAMSAGKLLFADAESSSVRFVNLDSERVETLSGGELDSPDLFTFGDADGPRGTARLQHPLDVEAWSEHARLQVLVADTYNHKVKIIAPDGSASTLAGGERGDSEGDSARFNEPSGLSLDGENLYIADTNNHKIKVLNLDTRRVSTLALRGLHAPAIRESAFAALGFEAAELQPVVISSGEAVQVLVEIVLAAGHHLSADSPQQLKIEIEIEIKAGSQSGRAYIVGEPRSPVGNGLRARFGAWAEAGARGTIEVSGSISYCTDAFGACLWEPVRARVGFEACPGGSCVVEMRIELAPAEPERRAANSR